MDDMYSLKLRILQQVSLINVRLFYSFNSNAVCPHIASLKSCPSDFFVDILNSTCSDCLTNKELWLCLVCLKLRCSRFNQRHMLEHFSDSGHCICLSVA